MMQNALIDMDCYLRVDMATGISCPTVELGFEEALAAPRAPTSSVPLSTGATVRPKNITPQQKQSDRRHIQMGDGRLSCPDGETKAKKTSV
jgi:hypothetical protein